MQTTRYACLEDETRTLQHALAASDQVRCTDREAAAAEICDLKREIAARDDQLVAARASYAKDLEALAATHAADLERCVCNENNAWDGAIFYLVINISRTAM